MNKFEKIEKIEKENFEKEPEMFELNWDTIQSNKINQHAKHIKASHEVRGDTVKEF